MAGNILYTNHRLAMPPVPVLNLDPHSNARILVMVGRTDKQVAISDILSAKLGYIYEIEGSFYKILAVFLVFAL